MSSVHNSSFLSNNIRSTNGVVFTGQVLMKSVEAKRLTRVANKSPLSVKRSKRPSVGIVTLFM